MAVYTKVSESEAATFLGAYDCGSLVSLQPIKSGVSNSNYRLLTTSGLHILTIYEGDAHPTDLDFFIGVMEYLAQRGILCPVPLRGHDGQARRMLACKPAVIVSFLEGVSILRVTPQECFDLGKSLAALHQAGFECPLRRENALSLSGWRVLFATTEGRMDMVQEGLRSLLRDELSYLSSNWPRHLPQGIIHADLFPDNVLFNQGKLCGLIDFNFACWDTLAYDIAVCLNAWCFEENNISFNLTKARALLQGYSSVRPLTQAEQQALPLLARGAAVRFLLTRLRAWLNQVPDALVKPKDPLDYLGRLNFHQRVNSITDYGLDIAA